MNFQAVREANGDLVKMSGRVMEIGASKLNVNKKPYQSAKIRDDTGEEHSATINRGNGQLLDTGVLDTQQPFSLSTYQGQRDIAYSGFWQGYPRTTVPPPTQADAPPQAPAGRPASQPEQKAEEKVDWDAKDLRMARMSGLNNATRIVCLLAEMEKDAKVSPQRIKEVAAEFVDFIYNGLPKKQSRAEAEEDAWAQGRAADAVPTDAGLLVLNKVLGQLIPPHGMEIDPDKVAEMIKGKNSGTLPTELERVPKIVDWLMPNVSVWAKKEDVAF